MTYDLAFYTQFYGSDTNQANRVPQIPSLKYDCYYFTNNKKTFESLKDTKYIAVFIDEPTTDDLIESCMKSKILKCMPESYPDLLKYKYLCYFDSKIMLNDTIVENILNTTFMDSTVSMVLRKHPAPAVGVHVELCGSVLEHRYKIQEEQYRKYIDGQVSNGLSRDIGTDEFHLACGFIVRDMTHPKTLEINKTWYEHIQLCGIQDQISFFFVKQLFKAYIKSCPWEIV